MRPVGRGLTIRLLLLVVCFVVLDARRKAQFAAFKQAIKAYSEGLEEKCGDTVLNSALLSNKAAVNLLMGNNRKVIVRG